LNQPRIHFFEKLAPHYDLLLDLLTFGGYATFLRKAIKILSPEKGEKILDLCSGTGRAASWMAEAVGPEGKVIGMDMARSMVEVAKQRYGGSKNLIFLQRDVTQPWEDQNDFDGIFTSFSIHELPEQSRAKVLEQAYASLKEKGRMVIADFNPQVSGIVKLISLLFFRLFERGNLNFFAFHLNQAFKGAGFKKIKTFSVSGGLFQITLAHKHSPH
jgi:demethylmenaquinone methyltransferase/2-methoxy-6-polyprenyl-1,4-benzoquinol methylase